MPQRAPASRACGRCAKVSAADCRAAEPPAAEVPPEGGSVAAPEAKQAPTPAVGTPGDAAGGKRKAEGGSGSVLTKQAKRSGPVTATPAAGLFRFWKK